MGGQQGGHGLVRLPPIRWSGHSDLERIAVRPVDRVTRRAGNDPHIDLESAVDLALPRFHTRSVVAPESRRNQEAILHFGVRVRRTGFCHAKRRILEALIR